MTIHSCPGCGSHIFLPQHGRQEIGQEVELRARFVDRRFDHKPQPAELMDLTHFMHGRPDALVACAACGLVIRDEPSSASYATDFYDRDLLGHLYPRYLRAFRDKERAYRHLLSPHAEVVEIGSHLGAFLQTAEEWNWHPTGLDIGKHSSAFAASRGVRVKRESLENTMLRSRSADAVFIWNCFEQLEEPGITLSAVRSLLKPGGTIVIRTPNFEFYKQWRPLVRNRVLGKRALRMLAYNNLLGFPYLIGYTPAALSSLLNRHGFRPIAGFDSNLITMPFPDLTPRVRKEANAAYAAFRNPEPKDPHGLSGPWIEIACRLEAA